MDADDVADPERLAAQLDAFAHAPKRVLVATAAVLIDAHGRSIATVGPPLAHEAIARALRVGNVLVHGSVMFRRAAWEAAGGYDEAARHVEDYDLWCRLLARGELAGLATPLYRLRVHGDSVSAAHVARQLDAAYHVRARYFGTPPPSWSGRRTALADRHLVYARRFAAAGEPAAAARHMRAAWRAKPWSPTVVRSTVAWLRGVASGRP
jgi:hypothetical protein